MKKTLQNIIAVALIMIAFAALAVFAFWDIELIGDEKANELLVYALPRLIAGCAVLGVIAVTGGGKALLPEARKLPRALLWCVPCFLVAAANFPYTALIGGSASIVRGELTGLFLLKCISVGLLEEALFRGLVQEAVGTLFEKVKYRNILTVTVTAAAFALIHLFNLISGAGVGETFLQVGYSFLIGAMLSAVMVKTGNLWLCVIIHAAFDFGGLIIPDLGTGSFQDVWFWVFTAVAGLICLIHVVLFLVKSDRK